MPLVVHRLTPYDPGDGAGEPGPCDTRIPFCSRETAAMACAAAVADFAQAAGVSRLTIDNPMTEGFFSFSVRKGRGTGGLDGLFPHDLDGYHDGARVPLATGLALVRTMVLRHGPWCRLHADNGFFVHVGTQDDVYVGADHHDGGSVARARGLGLFVERAERSPYDPALDTTEPQRPADGAFWAEVEALVGRDGGVLLEERPVGHAYRWHRPTSAADVREVRRRLTPRARLAVWPDLTEDAEAVRAAVLRDERPALLVRQYPGGGFHRERVAEPRMSRADVPNPEIPSGPGHRAALVPLGPADRRPPLAAVSPDPDGVLRARWRTDPTPAEERRAFLHSLRIGDVVGGVVASGLDDVGVHVDLDHPLGRGLGFLRVPEMSWEWFDSVDDVAPVGREIRAVVLHVDHAWEQVALSSKALLPDPWQRYADAHAVGTTVSGVVTREVPFGRFVRLAKGIEGLVPGGEGAGDGLAAGDEVRVTLIDVDLERRRIELSLDGPGRR
ncbi:S1 RNA-binding domain-containing protein [Streptomyces sp. NPDC026673]|uniref:S1 RNA-binding domain-containing protein n=1 Tax=Streptomyces sp. NPDC026673 TaxID=3155724 RepID=UPI0033ED3ABD